MNVVWNHSGTGYRVDRNMSMAEGVGIRYQICLGEYGTRTINLGTCSIMKTEYA